MQEKKFSALNALKNRFLLEGFIVLTGFDFVKSEVSPRLLLINLRMRE